MQVVGGFGHGVAPSRRDWRTITLHRKKGVDNCIFIGMVIVTNQTPSPERLFQ